MAEFGEGKSDNFTLFAIEEEGTEFGLCCGRHDELEDGTEAEDGTVYSDGLVVLGDGAEEEVAADTAACFWLREIGCIRMDIQYHI